jgi:protein OS-9
MVTTDTIAFVKEAKTCAYVLVVHTPRLCGEPGFMSKDAGQQASISCREVVAGELPDQSDAAFLPDADHPLKMSRNRPVLPLPPPGTAKSGSAADGKGSSKYTDALRKAIGSIKEFEMIDDGEGNVFIQLVDDIPADGDVEALQAAAVERIANLLREAGVDIKMAGNAAQKTGAAKSQKKKKNGDEKQDANDAADRRREVDEYL